MKIGLALPHYGFSFPDHGTVSFARVASVVERAEELGFDSVWISDHFFLSLAKYGGGDDLHGSIEPMTTLAGLSSLTSRIRLGTMVLGAPFRHPGVLARMAASADRFSNGRLELGLGAGWYEEEFEAFGYEFEGTGDRFAMLEEQLQVLRALSVDEAVTHEGERYSLHDARVAPFAAPPLWLGAKGGPRALRLAARYADGWNAAWRWTPETYGERARAADAACEREGRDPASLRRAVGLFSLVGESQDDLVAQYRALQAWAPGGALDGEPLEDYMRDTLTGTPERVRELVAEYAALGVDEIIVNAGSVPFSLFDEQMLDAIAETLIAA
jgi:probable F420-dependent oxidoreductase